MQVNVMIIDDSADDVFAIKRMLKKISLELKISKYTDPHKALDALLKDSVDCIILDFNFPTMNGLEFIKECNKKKIDTPIILLTGQGNEKIAVEVLKNGASDYIVKNELSGKLLNTAILKGIEKRNVTRSEKAQHEFIKTLVDVIPIPLFYKDRDGIYRGCNQAFEAFIGKSKDEIIGKTVADILNDNDNDATKYRAMDQVLFDNPGKQTYEDEFVNSDNESRYIIFDKVTYNNAFDEVEGIIGIITDITESKRREIELAEKTYTDSLTGISNRRFFDENIQKIWERCILEKASLSLIMIDIDLFKNFNDYYGHQEGDVCLKKVAEIIKNALHRFTDRVVRYGGEEFLVILPNTNKIGALEVAERIQQEFVNVAIKHEASNVNKIVTVSQGIAEISNETHSVFDCLMQADQSLYQAKENGRNRIEVYL